MDQFEQSIEPKKVRLILVIVNLGVMAKKRWPPHTFQNFYIGVLQQNELGDINRVYCKELFVVRMPIVTQLGSQNVIDLHGRVAY